MISVGDLVFVRGRLGLFVVRKLTSNQDKLLIPPLPMIKPPLMAEVELFGRAKRHLFPLRVHMHEKVLNVPYNDLTLFLVLQAIPLSSRTL
jgi:hypothetical protein